MTIFAFQKYILSWYKIHKRDSLLWRPRARSSTEDHSKLSGYINPYYVLVSEIMLQQTQVSRVREKYPAFIKEFPTLHVLAHAQLRNVLRNWKGMGYNRRARYLHDCAKIIEEKYESRIPKEPDVLKTLPGIGEYTSGAIVCFAYNAPVVFFDTNIRKVFIHFFFPKGKVSDKEILPIAKEALYKKNPRDWHYALMDYGALELNKKNDLLARVKGYYKQSPFEGSPRYFRSKIVRHLLDNKKATKQQLAMMIRQDSLFSEKITSSKLLVSLTKDQLIRKRGNYYSIA